MFNKFIRNEIIVDKSSLIPLVILSYLKKNSPQHLKKIKDSITINLENRFHLDPLDWLKKLLFIPTGIFESKYGEINAKRDKEMT